MKARPADDTVAVPAPRPTACELCERSVALTFHHLIPRRNHRRPWFQAHFSKEELASRGAWLCRLCHNAVHEQFDENTLGRQLNTLEALRAEPILQRHVQWAARQRHHRAW